MHANDTDGYKGGTKHVFTEIHDDIIGVMAKLNILKFLLSSFVGLRHFTVYLDWSVFKKYLF